MVVDVGLLVVGKQQCSRCDMTKNILNNKQIDFEYVLMEDLSEEDKAKYRKMAITAKQLEMPLIIKDNKIITLQEVI
jgi:glutaredoxin